MVGEAIVRERHESPSDREGFRRLACRPDDGDAGFYFGRLLLLQQAHPRANGMELVIREVER